MKNYILIIITFFFISNCNLNKVVKHHGVHFLEKKHQKLTINETNKNDIISIVGPPSTKSLFDNDLWIYIERTKQKRSIFSLGKEKLVKNNVLILEIDSRGRLIKKSLLDINDINKYKFSEGMTQNEYSKNSFVYDFLSSVRQKVNNATNSNQK